MATESSMVAVDDRQDPVHRTEGGSAAADLEERHRLRAKAKKFRASYHAADSDRFKDLGGSF